jgi:hypothetical protein
MSRKHNTKHHRSRSHYKERLAARGLRRSPLTFYHDLWKGGSREKPERKAS